MKKLFLLFVVVGLVLFIGCSENAEMQTTPEIGEKQIVQANSNNLEENCVTFSVYEENGIELYRVENCSGNIFKIIVDENDFNKEEIKVLRHPQRFYYLSHLINQIEENVILLRSNQNKRLLLNKLESLQRSNASYNGTYNKIYNDILPLAKRIVVNGVYYNFIYAFLVYHLEINRILEWEPNATVYAAADGPFGAFVDKIAYIYDCPAEWTVDMTRCIACKIGCHIGTFEQYRVCGWISKDQYGCYIPEENQEAYRQAKENCIEGSCNCPNCPCSNIYSSN